MDARAAIESLLARMTVEEKIGQLVMATLPGTEMDEATAARLREGHYAGVVLFSRNIASVPQTLTLTAAIRDCCTLEGLPPIIGVDQEGGRVRRLMAEATATPSAMALGATGDVALVERIGAAVGRELRALGINTDFAPVADVNNNPRNPVIGTRSFGESPEQVGAMVVAFARGLRSAGVAAAAKHFPGHGDTQVDSHLDLPTIAHGLDRLRAVELPPFAAAIRAGVPLVMTSHIRFPALEPDGLPATLSPRILNGLLREEMGFDGVIISDAMMMKAIDDYYGIVAGSVQAVIAGNDIVEPLSVTDEPAVIAGLRDAVRDGRLSMAQLDASVRRILRLKRWLAAQQGVGIEAVGTHGAIVRAAAEESVTLLDARTGMLPISAASGVGVIEFALQSMHAAEEGQAAPSPLRDAFQQQFANVQGIALDATNPAADDLAAASRLAAEATIVIIGTRDANLFPAQRQAIDMLQAANRPTIFVSMRAPYDLADFPWAAARIATYGDLPASLTVAAAICAGAQTPRGHLPVSVGPLYPMGHGLTEIPL
jgi:beta-N-acetylhexosaminidase